MRKKNDTIKIENVLLHLSAETGRAMYVLM